MFKEIILITLILISINAEILNLSPITENTKSIRVKRFISGVSCKHVTHTGKCIHKKRNKNRKHVKIIENSRQNFEQYVVTKVSDFIYISYFNYDFFNSFTYFSKLITKLLPIYG